MAAHPADPVERFLSADPAERALMARQPGLRGPLAAWLGEDALAAYDAIRAELEPQITQHLAPGAPKNLVFVPGVMGSVLTSQGLGGVWWIDVRTRRHIADLRLADDGVHDADPNAEVTAVAVDTTYEMFFSAVVARSEFGHVGFPYDWRKPLLTSTRQLRKLVTGLYKKNGGQPVHLVAHSMGGLVVRAALMEHPELWDRVGRIVFLGTPHYGSAAIGGYLKNHLWGFEMLALLGRYLDRATFRSLWGVLSLLPAPVGVYPGTRGGDPPRNACEGDYPHPCANFDLYQASAWKLRLADDEAAHLQQVLDGAASFHRRLYDWHVGLDQTQRDRMAVIAGVGYKTLFQLAYKPALGFLWEVMDRITRVQKGNPHRDGDGRVPLASAMLENVGATRFIRAEHGGLPGVKAVYEDAFRWLLGQPMNLEVTPQAAWAKHLGADLEIASPLAPVRPPTGAYQGAQPPIDGVDPGYLDWTLDAATEFPELEQALAEERLPEFHRIHLL